MARRRVCAQAIVVNNKHVGKFMSESNDLTENAHTHTQGQSSREEEETRLFYSTGHLVLK